MCHQSVGLIANVLEGMGISTMLISTNPVVVHGTGAPRAMHIRFPQGNSVGEPNKPEEQRRILLSALEIAPQLVEPGSSVNMPYRWRRMGSRRRVSPQAYDDMRGKV